MKPTQIAELLANIRKTFVSFFSILMFVALGAGIFVGIYWSSPALQTAADRVFAQGSFHNVQVTYPYGLTQSDLDQLAGLEGVVDVEPGRLSYATYSSGAQTRTVKVQTLGTRIDTPVSIEGTLPAQPNEIAIKASSAATLGIHVGDVLRLNVDKSAAGTAQLNASEFTVTALIETPEYIALSDASLGYAPKGTGDVNAVGWVVPEAFNDAAYQDGYTLASVRVTGLEGLNTFSDEYKNASRDFESRISELGGVLAPARYDDLHGQVQAKVDEGEAQLAEAESKIAEAEQLVAEGEAQLAEGRTTFEQLKSEGEAKLAEAYSQLQTYESQRTAGAEQLATLRNVVNAANAGLAEIDEDKALAEEAYAASVASKAELDAKLAAGEITQEEHDAALDEYGDLINPGLQEYARETGKTIPLIDHTNFDEGLAKAREALDNSESTLITIQGTTMTVAEARTKAAELNAQLAEAQSTYDALSAQLENGWAQYYAGRDELAAQTAAFEARTAEGEAQIESVRQQIEEGRQQIEEKTPELDAAKEQLGQMKQYTWSVAGRAYNGGTAEASLFSGVTNRLSLSMAALFVIVGLLVSYSAVSRLVHEQIIQIGTKKALGLRGTEITLSFLAYSALAVIAGCIVGITVGVTVVETIIGRVLGARFIMGTYPPYVGIGLALGVTALELVLVLGATWLACRRILREHAVELLRGEKPPEAKTRFYEKWAVWERLPLFTQTMVNNCINDKRRVFSTVVGVAGCTALIVTAITLNDDVMASYDYHYKNVYDFNGIAFVDTSVAGSADAVESALEREGATTAVPARRQSFSVSQSDGSLTSIRILVPDDEEDFARAYHVNVIDGAPYGSTEGAWVSQAYKRHYGAKVGDELRLDGGDGTVHVVPIAGFMDFGLTSLELVMPRATYESVFDTQLTPNVILADTGEHEVADIAAAIQDTPGYVAMSDDKAIQSKNFKDFSSISRTVVAIYLVLSVLMAIVVLLNLNVMFIEEKKRELIVLMINGFSVRDAKRYIYNDTIVLTAIGIVLGLIVGGIMGAITVDSVEPNSAVFLKGIAWRAMAVGAGGSALLAVVMSMIALRRIPRFNLTDINKA